MTDEQIIKAFEEIIKNQNDKLSLIEQAVCADVLSLIKRTKDESNKHRNKYRAVKAEFTRLYDTVCCQKAEIGELKAITGIMNTRKYYRKFVDEVFEKEMGNMRMSPDFDYIYELYFKQRAEIEELRERISYLEKSIDCSRKEYNRLLQKLQQVKSEAIKEFAERLCKGRVKNDPVVIAVKSELKEMEGGNSV